MQKILPHRGMPDFLRECLFSKEKLSRGARFPGVQNILWHRMAKAHKCPLAAVYTAVSREAWKAVVLGSFVSPKPQTWWDCRKKLLNNINGRRQPKIILVEVSSSLLLPQVATASKSLWMVYLLVSELGSLLRHGNPYCTLRPLPSFTAIQL